MICNTLRLPIHQCCAYAGRIIAQNRHILEVIKCIAKNVFLYVAPPVIGLLGLYVILINLPKKQVIEKIVTQTVDTTQIETTARARGFAEAAYACFPLIEADRTLEVQNYISRHHLSSISLGVHHDKDQFAATSDKDNDIKTLPDRFTLPVGTISLILDNVQIPLTGHKIHRLVLKNYTGDDLFKLIESAKLPCLDTLVLEGVTLTTEQLDELATKFPQIACFDVQTLTASETLKENCLVHDASGDNYKQHYLDLNAFLRSLTQEANSDTYISRLSHGDGFLYDDEKRLPAARFITHWNAFEGSHITDGGFRKLIGTLNNCCPHLQTLNLNKCSNLTYKMFHDKELTKTKIKCLILDGCERLFKVTYSMKEEEFVTRGLANPRTPLPAKPTVFESALDKVTDPTEKSLKELYNATKEKEKPTLFREYAKHLVYFAGLPINQLSVKDISISELSDFTKICRGATQGNSRKIELTKGDGNKTYTISGGKSREQSKVNTSANSGDEDLSE